MLPGVEIAIPRYGDHSAAGHCEGDQQLRNLRVVRVETVVCTGLRMSDLCAAKDEAIKCTVPKHLNHVCDHQGCSLLE